MVPLTNSLKHAAASQNFLGDRWCLVVTVFVEKDSWLIKFFVGSFFVISKKCYQVAA